MSKEDKKYAGFRVYVSTDAYTVKTKEPTTMDDFIDDLDSTRWLILEDDVAVKVRHIWRIIPLDDKKE